MDLWTHGLGPYERFARVMELPDIFKYYVVLAVGVEFYLSASLWFKSLYKSGIILAAGLISMGLAVSIYTMIYRLQLDCGCGLLGENQLFYMLQKGLLLIGLVVLYRARNDLFADV